MFMLAAIPARQPYAELPGWYVWSPWNQVGSGRFLGRGLRDASTVAEFQRAIRDAAGSSDTELLSIVRQNIDRDRRLTEAERAGLRAEVRGEAYGPAYQAQVARETARHQEEAATSSTMYATTTLLTPTERTTSFWMKPGAASRYAGGIATEAKEGAPRVVRAIGRGLEAVPGAPGGGLPNFLANIPWKPILITGAVLFGLSQIATISRAVR